MKQSINIFRVCVVTLCIFSSTTILAQNYPEGMISYWKFEEGSGSTVFDVVGNNDGTLKYAPQWTVGKVGSALSFDGINDYVEIADAASLDINGPITIEAWVMQHGSGGRHPGIISKYDYSTGPYRSYALLLHFNQKPAFIITPTGYDPFYEVIANDIKSDIWYHLAGVYDGSTMKIYVNGDIEDSRFYNRGIYINNRPLYIGAYNDNAFKFNGIIDEAAIYNRALTVEEINQHYQNGLNGFGYEIPVTIDIKPGIANNFINPNSNGLIPVAIISTSKENGELIDFDATDVDAFTVKFGPYEASIAHKDGHIEDVDGDGDNDLLLHFKTRESGIQCGDVEAFLTCETYHSLSFYGYDEIISVGCNNMNQLDKTDYASETLNAQDKFILNPCYPNPFNPSTTISYSLPKDSQIELSIYNSLGQKIAILVSAKQSTGMYEITWRPSDIPSGVYFVKLSTGDFHKIKKVIYIQ